MASPVIAEIRVGIACVRQASTATPLSEQYDPISGRVERSAHAWGAPRARPAVKHDRRLPSRVAAEFPVQPMPTHHVQQTAVVRLDRRIELRNAQFSLATVSTSAAVEAYSA